MKEFMDFYKLDKKKLLEYRDALGTEILVKSLNMATPFSELRKHIRPRFGRMIKHLRDSVNINGNPREMRLVDRLDVYPGSVLDLKVVEELAEQQKQKVDVLFSDFSAVDCSSDNTVLAFMTLLGAVPEMKRTSSLMVIAIADHITSSRFMNVLSEGFFNLQTSYAQISRKPKIRSPFGDNTNSLVVIYSLYSERLKHTTDPNQINEAFLSSFSHSGHLENFEEREDEAPLQTAGEKSERFYGYLANLFMDESRVAVCFGESELLLKCFLVSTFSSNFSLDSYELEFAGLYFKFSSVQNIPTNSSSQDCISSSPVFKTFLRTRVRRIVFQVLHCPKHSYELEFSGLYFKFSSVHNIPTNSSSQDCISSSPVFTTFLRTRVRRIISQVLHWSQHSYELEFTGLYLKFSTGHNIPTNSSSQDYISSSPLVTTFLRTRVHRIGFRHYY